MRLASPIFLLLLPLILPIVRIGWPSRGYGRGRERAAVILRVISMALLILSLAGVEFVQGNDTLAVVFLVDASDSMPAESQQAARSYVENALLEMGPDDQAAVILFGGNALVERPMSADRDLDAFASIPNTTQTDLAEAIRLAMALYPSNTARRMVLISDGNATVGDAEAAARLAVSSGVEFVVVPVAAPSPEAEITLLGVVFPARLIQGENFEAQITLHSTAPAEATLRILAAGSVVYEASGTLEGGLESFRIPLTAGEPDFINYEVQLTGSPDHFYQNNELAAYSQVTGPPTVLIVAPPAGEIMPFSGEPRPDEFSHLVNALLSAGFTVETVRPSGLSFELAVLSQYASIVLVDVPARDLSNSQMEALQSYVRDLGGGLVAVGGPTSFGVGGYFRTPLEATLPVDMEIKDQERRPSLTMIFIIDHSGSMGETSGGVTKLDLAKEAAARSVELLFPGDKVGVIAFDDSATWVVPITDLSDAETVISQIEAIGLGGGTDILAGLQAMANTLPADDSLVKHVILLTDGGASALGIPTLVEDLYQQYGITLTTVGVGSDSAPFLKDIAALGGGRYHFTDRPESIPSIFTEETTLATRSYIIEEPFFPELFSRSPIVAGITEVPALYGYVGATAKTTAQTILVSDKGDPILAAWQYGLGKAVAWTSDATSRWAQDWVTWAQFPAFWAQAVRYTVTERATSPLNVSVAQDGETATITVDAIAEGGQFLNNYAMTVNVIDPVGTVQTLTIPQIAPGLYETEFIPDLEGAYLLRVDGADPNGENAAAEIAGWVLSYSPEYRPILAPGAADAPEGFHPLEILASRTEGLVADLGSVPSGVFAHTLVSPDSARPLWPELLTLAVLLLPFDIALRRLAFERRDIARIWQRAVGRLIPAPAPAMATATAARPARMENLRRAKERVVEEDARRRKETTPPATSLKALQKPEVLIPTLPKKSEGGIPPPSTHPSEAPTPIDGSATPPDSTTSALLKRKRERGEHRKS